MRINILSAIAVSFILIISSCSRENIQTLNVKRNFSGSIWIVRNSISSPDRIDDLLDIIRDSDIKNIFVQVRGRGDAYYDSSIEPRGFDVNNNFDPLMYLIKKTRNTDIRIHAWVNISFVINAKDYPGPEKHVLTKHPEWVTWDYNGRPMTQYTQKELDDNLLEGFFLDPAIPDVKQYCYEIIRDILSNYDIDGIHMDYVRYPYSGYNTYYKKFMSEFGYNPISRKIFKKKYGFDPLSINREKESKAKYLFDRFRMDQITEIVKNIHDIVKQKDTSLTVSAAVMPRYDYGKKVYFQDWPLWLNRGYIDLACVMSYTENSDTYGEYIDYALNTGCKDKILMGVMVKEKTSVRTIINEITAAYNKGTRGYILFSFEHNEDYIDRISRIIEHSRYVQMLN